MSEKILEAITDAQLDALEQTAGYEVFEDLDDAPVTFGELRGLVVRLRAAEKSNQIARSSLNRLAQVPGCGCSFPCRCGGDEWTKAELEGRIDEAAEALKAMEVQP